MGDRGGGRDGGIRDNVQKAKQKNLPTGVSRQYSPGAVPYVEGASLGHIVETALSGPMGPIGTAVTLGKIAYQGITGKPAPSLFSDGEGVQTGWSADRTRGAKGGPKGNGLGPGKNQLGAFSTVYG